jgi:hypothetical protein
MFFTFDQQLKHQKSFLDAYVDLKVQGWRQYSTALDSYTLGYWKTALKQLDEQVQETGEAVKANFTFKHK